MNWKLVIFDLDGTLINTIDDLGTAVNFALSSRGLPLHEIQDYKKMVGGGVRNLVWKALPEQYKEDTAMLEELLAVFMEYYKAHICVHSHPYTGMQELLHELNSAGIKIAVASNKFQAGTEMLIARIFPEVEFVSVYGGRPDVPLKPDPAVIATILSESAVAAEDAVMIGDSGTDTRTAAAAGIASVAVTWGFKPESAVLGADHVAGTWEQLRALLLA